MPIRRIALDELLPDQPFVGDTNGMAEANNVIPIDSRWRPVKRPMLVASGPSPRLVDSSSEVVAARYSYVRDTVIFGTLINLGAGTPPHARLWEADTVSGSVSPVDGGGYFSLRPNGWSFTEFDSFFIATNGLDPVLFITAAAAAFANLITSTTVPKARLCATAKTHLVLAWINEGGVNYSRRVWWSAQGNPQNFNVGSARSGFIDLAAADGEITGIIGGEESFVIFTEGKVVLFEYVGGDQVWFPREIGAGPESLAPEAQHSIVKRGGNIYYRGRDGYKVISGDAIANIGDSKVRSYVREMTVAAPLPGAVDQISGLVVWVGQFGLEGGVLATLERTMLVWNPSEDRFSTVTLVDHLGVAIDPRSKYIVPAYAPGGGDSDNLNNLVFILSNRTAGGEEYRVLRLNGELYAAWRMKSRLVEPVPGETSIVIRVRPVIELEEGTGRVPPEVTVELRLWNDAWKKKQPADSPLTFNSETDLNDEGWGTAGFPASAHRWEFILAGAEVDAATKYVPINLLGVDVDFDAFSED